MTQPASIPFKGSVKTLLLRRLRTCSDWESSTQAIVDVFGNAPLSIQEELSKGIYRSAKNRQPTVSQSSEPVQPTATQGRKGRTNEETYIVRDFLVLCYEHRDNASVGLRKFTNWSSTRSTLVELATSLKDENGITRDEFLNLSYRALKEVNSDECKYVIQKWEQEKVRFTCGIPQPLYFILYNYLKLPDSKIGFNAETGKVKWID